MTCQGPLMLVDSEPQEYMPLTELGHGWQGQTKRGSEMGKYPPCQEE